MVDGSEWNKSSDVRPGSLGRLVKKRKRRDDLRAERNKKRERERKKRGKLADEYA